jgi:hypothetical protein
MPNLLGNENLERRVEFDACFFAAGKRPEHFVSGKKKERVSF